MHGVATFGQPEEGADRQLAASARCGAARPSSRSSSHGSGSAAFMIAHNARETLGKVERFWKTLWDEFLGRTVFARVVDARRRLDHFVNPLQPSASAPGASRALCPGRPLLRCCRAHARRSSKASGRRERANPASPSSNRRAKQLHRRQAALGTTSGYLDRRRRRQPRSPCRRRRARPSSSRRPTMPRPRSATAPTLRRARRPRRAATRSRPTPRRLTTRTDLDFDHPSRGAARAVPVLSREKPGVRPADRGLRDLARLLLSARDQGARRDAARASAPGGDGGVRVRDRGGTAHHRIKQLEEQLAKRGSGAATRGPDAADAAQSWAWGQCRRAPWATGDEQNLLDAGWAEKLALLDDDEADGGAKAQGDEDDYSELRRRSTPSRLRPRGAGWRERGATEMGAKNFAEAQAHRATTSSHGEGPTSELHAGAHDLPDDPVDSRTRFETIVQVLSRGRSR